MGGGIEGKEKVKSKKVKGIGVYGYKDGRMEKWNGGMLEYWNNGVM
jgi:hypothetical protein